VTFVALLLLGLGILGASGREDVWKEQIAPEIKPKVLPEVFSGINATVEKVFHSSSGGLIAFAAVVAIWEVAGMVRTCMNAIATIYDEEDTRPIAKRFAVSLGIAFVMTLAIVGAVLLATAAAGAVTGAWEIPFAIGRWLLAVVLIGFAFGVLLRYAPPESRTTAWTSGGSALVVVAWILQTLVFALYLRHASYRTAVGSLLGVYFLTTFLYVGAIILLVGIELDEQLRREVKGEHRQRGIIELVREIV
jgi:membrane protein